MIRPPITGAVRVALAEALAVSGGIDLSAKRNGAATRINVENVGLCFLLPVGDAFRGCREPNRRY